jgi:hypothetical protein
LPPMNALFVSFIAAALAATATQPSQSLSTNRNGRQGTVRFAGFATQAGSNVVFGNQFYNTQSLTATWKVGSTVVDTTTISQGAGFLSYEDIDTGNNGQATLTLTVQTASPQTINSGSCSGITLSQSDRETIVITSSATSPTFNSGTCSAGTSGVCTGSTLQSNGTASFQCSVIRDQLSDPRSCTTVPVRVYSNNPTCPVFLELEDLETGTGDEARETFLTGLTVPTNFGTDAGNNPLNLDRDTNYAINDGQIFTPGTTARFLDLFISSSGVATPDADPFETAFLNVANLAYRATAGVKDNSFVLVITQGTNNNVVLPQSEFVNVVHFVASPQNVGQALASWVEVEADSQYTLRVYDNSVTQTNIFGTDPTGTGGTSPAALAVGTTQQLLVNDMRIFRITNDADTSTLVVNNVPLSTSTSPLVPDGKTKFIIWNNVVSKSLQLAAPDSECCHFLSDEGEGVGGQVFTHSTTGNPTIGDANTLSPAPLDGTSTFSVFGSSASCPNIGTSVTPSATVSLTDLTSAGECSVDGVFLYARTNQVTTNSCIGPTPVGTSCTGSSTFNSVTSDVIVSMKGQPNDLNTVASVDFSVSITVPLCDCFVEPSTPSCDVCERDEFDAVNANVNAALAALSSAISSSESTINSNVDAVDANVVNVNTTQNANAADLRSRVASVQSSVNALSSSTNADADNILGETDNIRSDIKKVRKDIKNIKDDIKKL